MEVFIATTWEGLRNYLSALSGSDLSIEIQLNMTQAEVDSPGAVQIVTFPENVKSCVLSSLDRAINYKMSITTARDKYFELTIKDLYIDIREARNVIDIAKAEFTGTAENENYNRLNFDGNNVIYVRANGSEVHIGGNTGLYINLMQDSVTQLGPVGVTTNLAAKIGGIQGEDGGTIYLGGEGTVQVRSYRGAGIGGGGGTETGLSGEAGDGGNIQIYESAKVELNCYYGAGIGGGSTMRGLSGSGGNIKIYGNANVTGSSTFGTAIGAGSNSMDDGSNGGSIEIYGNAVVDVSSSYTVIGGSSSAAGGNGGDAELIMINENANVTASSTSGTGIGGGTGTVGGDAGSILINDNAVVTVNSTSGIGIGAGKNSDGTITGAGTIIISTSGLLTINQNANNVLSIGGGDDCTVIINGTGGINGTNLTVVGEKLILSELVYDTLTFDNGYIVINNPGHEPKSADRGDYFILNLTKNNDPYTSPVILYSEAVGSENEPLSEEIIPDSNGKIQMYISNGQYYFQSNGAGIDRTESFTVDTSVTHDDPNLPLTLSLVSGAVSGNVQWKKEGSTGPMENVLVSLYNSDKSRANYDTMTDENGNYLIKNVVPGSYYIGFSNTPNDYVFEAGEESSIGLTGLTKQAYAISDANPEIVTDAGINYLIAPPGKTGATGPKGADGNDFPSSSVNMFKLNTQLVLQYHLVDLGEVIEANGSDVSFSPDKNAIILNEPGTYMVNYNVYVAYASEHSNQDYLALQLKLGDNFLIHGFSYTFDNGILHNSAIVRNHGYARENVLQIVNVGSSHLYMRNLNITVFRVS